VLQLNKDVFYDNLFSWAKKFNFKVDGDYLIVEDADIDGFIANLDTEIELWGKNLN